MSTLFIFASDPQLRDLIKEQINCHRWTDSGFDVPMLASDRSIGPVVSFDLGIQVGAINKHQQPEPCLLVTRSSIFKTPFRLCNSIGLIDAGYRGEVKAKCDNIDRVERIIIDNGVRYFQLCTRNFKPWRNIIIVDKFENLPAPPDNRGAGGFGSTG